YLADVLRRAHLLDGLPWSEMAVVVRTASSLGPLRRALAHAGVPVTVSTDDLPLAAQPAVAPFLSVLTALLPAPRPGDEHAVAGRLALAQGGSAEDVLWAMWQRSGLATRWARASAAGGATGAVADRDLDAVVALFDAAAGFVDRLPSADVRAFVAHLSAQELP